ncbi:DNA (cytosine-5-)-methyltransferase [Streptomyces sp. NPDC059900]|uniref:DNA cytosine methyltransferase n=1 Tax=Streptomyces sp. NPDC059900 TaxID=3155816 RepID=UPI00343AE7BD
MAAAELRIGSLYSGVGGLDLGVQSAFGGRVAWHAENDSLAVQVLARHWPTTPNLGDVRTADWGQAEPIDILTAGFPCQELSVAGPRTGLAGARSGLWQYAVEAIHVLRPRLVVIENVRGLLSTRSATSPLRALEPGKPRLGDPSGQPSMRALGVLLGDLADCGYNASWRCVRASDVGAPHRRERVFITAWPTTPLPLPPVEDADGEPRCDRRIPAPCQTQGGRTRPHPRRRGRTSPAHADSQRRCQGLPEPAPRQRQPHSGLHGGDACRSVYRDGCWRGASACRTVVQRHQSGHRAPPQPGGGERTPAAHPDHVGREGRAGYDAETQRRHESTNGGHSPASWWSDYLPAIRRWERVTGRAAPMATVPGQRRLSAEFVEWMMGLHDHVTGTPNLTRAARLRLLGNAVVPQQASYALGALISRDGQLCGADPVWRDFRGPGRR